MSFSRYPAYRATGVEWMRNVPDHWKVVPIKRLFRVVGGSTPRSDREAFWDGEVLWATPADLSKRESLYIGDTQRKITPDGLESCGTNLVPEDSIILSTRAPIGSLAIATTAMSTNQGCKALVPFDGTDSKFFAHLLSVSTTELNIRGKGTTFLELSGDELGAFRVPVPPVSEQKRIASFLDKETLKIDRLTDEQRRLIGVLKEKRQAIVSDAVTKGLNGDAPMKPSGCEWPADVPAHWTVRRLKYVSPQVTVGIVVEPSKYYVSEGIPALRSLNVSSGAVTMEDLVFISSEANDLHSKSKLRSGDLVVVRSGQPGTTAVIPQELDGCNCIDLLIVRKPSYGSEWFLCWYLSSDAAVSQFAVGSGGAIQQHFNVGTAAELVVPVPPEPEQVEIAEYLRAKSMELDVLTSTARKAIDLLLERRSALIAAAVTGQIDVREFAHAEAA